MPANPGDVSDDDSFDHRLLSSPGSPEGGRACPALAPSTEEAHR
eukprot:CAMPEP_0182912646 /NCGR_PEP_ID=MMETSP0034_2-20130328/37623_1 /TAXON_ID=156128 /ORGANISM="Nephroselmis pyriformis, Strain CCMP717" /LENGTH=43 /DNA_ID= /DNA_START= /DNA_END= /DNA_ORIENTATION=